MMKRMLRLKAPVASWMHFAITDISYGLLKKADFHLAINSETFSSSLTFMWQSQAKYI